ncbi:MAG: hypothetical protein H9W83_11250, partial [Leuconostoc sp.]|nr:hypothetical protein [Leuconostoc sp.]
MGWYRLDVFLLPVVFLSTHQNPDITPRRNPYSFLRGYRENHEGGFDPNFVPVPYPGEFGGLGSFIVGGLAGAFLASAFGNKHDQAAHPAQATTTSVQPVIQPVPVVQGMPYNYSPYG